MPDIDWRFKAGEPTTFIGNRLAAGKMYITWDTTVAPSPLVHPQVAATSTLHPVTATTMSTAGLAGPLGQLTVSVNQLIADVTNTKAAVVAICEALHRTGLLPG